jgi:hypothetical protein
LGRTATCSTSSRTWDRRTSSGRAVYQISHNANGGFCAYGVAVGAQFDGDPRLWKIVDGKLSLNLNPDMQKKWERDIPGHMTKADTNWSVMQDKVPAALGEAFGSAFHRPALPGGVRRATGAFGTETARPRPGGRRAAL